MTESTATWRAIPARPRLDRGGAVMSRAAAALLLVAAVTAAPAADISQDEARRLRDAGKILPLEEIMAAAVAIEPGRVIDSELERENGRYVYEIELLDGSGTVHELEFDAASGELLDREIED